MLLAKRLGRPVVDAGGTQVGRLEDVSVILDRQHPVVHRLVVRGARRRRLLLPWAQVAELTGGTVRLAVEGATLPAPVERRDLVLEPGELLLARDVMDTQVVDLQGRRLVRVADVLLVRLPTGEWEVAAVDVGTGALLRRMGLPRLGERLAPVVVDWADLHLTSSRGHLVQLATSTAGMHRLDSRGLAELLARLSTGKGADVLRSVGPERAAGAVRHSHPFVGRRLLHALGRDERFRLLAVEEAGDRPLGGPGARPPMLGRRFLRTAGWRIRRPPRAPHGTQGA
jgi:sporulation protein YlmC with PRC-barrel domain